MEYRELGAAKLSISILSFGAGPISGLMVGEDNQRQADTVARALSRGVNWFDTAATYGAGQSEQALGAALRRTGANTDFALATKVRVATDQLTDIAGSIRRSFEASLARLQVDRVRLLQLHNSVTKQRDDLPTSLARRDIFDPGGVLETFQALRDEGLVEALGFTGLGDRLSLQELLESRAFTAVQIPLNLLTPFSGDDAAAGSLDVDYLDLVAQCAEHQVGVLAIRVFAGGALVGQPPSQHTHRTKFFPLDLYRRDQARAQRLQEVLPEGMTLAEASLRYAAHLPGVTSALVGFAEPTQIDEAIRFVQRGPLPAEVWSLLCEAACS